MSSNQSRHGGASMDESSRYERGLAKLREYTLENAGGSQTHFKVAEELTDIAPDVARYIIEFAYGDIYTRRHLTNQERAIVTVSSLVTLGTEAQIELHVNTALTSGMSADKIVEILIQLIPYTGFPRVLNALSVAKRVFTQRGANVSAEHVDSVSAEPHRTSYGP